jgi:hypothetical protein
VGQPAGSWWWLLKLVTFNFVVLLVQNKKSPTQPVASLTHSGIVDLLVLVLVLVVVVAPSSHTRLLHLQNEIMPRVELK